MTLKDAATHARRRLATTVGAVCFALCMGLIGFGTGIYATQRPSVVILELRQAGGVAVRGGWLDMDVRLIRNHICDPKVEGWLWQWQDGVKHWVALPVVPSPPVELGQQARYIVSIPVPANITPGKWNYMTRTHDGCPSMFSLRPETVRDDKVREVIINDPTSAQPTQVVTPPGPVTIMPIGK